MPRQRQRRMQVQIGSLAAIQQLENRTDEQLLSESRYRAAARAILGARAAERYDVKQARGYFNEALAAAHPQERPALRNMMKASLALAERRPDELRHAVEKLGQEPPSARQLLLLRLMGLIAPPPGASVLARVRGALLLLVVVAVLLGVGFGIVLGIGTAAGGISIAASVLLGLVLMVAVLGVLTLLGRRRQGRARERARERAAEQAELQRRLMRR